MRGKTGCEGRYGMRYSLAYLIASDGSVNRRKTERWRKYGNGEGWGGADKNAALASHHLVS